MIYVKAYFGTLVAFLLLDSVWLGLIARDYYREQIGHLMSDSPNWAAAGGFYLLYFVGVVALAVTPALEARSWKKALFLGGLLGMVAYGTYDMTNLAVLRDWPLAMTAIDIVWGTALTGLASVAGFYASRPRITTVHSDGDLEDASE